ncbi:MAG: HypC/HybG/HupF family hydrogenase formation chaperone [Bacteroidota bacterium]|nr:HypC/HybG/HupF family hydrogenase formation chaperone [Bacteroidota bacterium]
MCLAIPGKIESIDEHPDPFSKKGKVNFSGVSKEVSFGFLPAAKVGDYVIVHVGFAISKVDEEEALKIFEYYKQMREFKEI